MMGINGHADPFILDAPSMIDIGVMGHCKNNCKICYQGNKTQPNMKIKDYKNLISSVKDHVNQVALGGRGDPNHHENFKEIMTYTYRSGVVPNFTTSGIGLTDGQIEYAKIAGAVAVSDYEQDFTYNAIERLMAANIKTNIHQVFTKETAKKCIDIVNGVDVWNKKVYINMLNAVIFLLFKPQGRGKNHPDLIPTEEQIKEFSKAIRKPKCKFKIGMDSCMVNRLKQVDNPFSKAQEMMIDSCEGARMSCYVSPDMKFMPCSFCDHEKEGISILKKPVQKVWKEGHSFKSVRDLLSKDPIQCPYSL
jgi:MoaA/NifB/PqqE/SkfB family radical SAM enzyme